MNLNEFLTITISFVAGSATVIATFYAIKQFKRLQGRIEFVRAHASPKVPELYFKQGFIFSFHIALLNRGKSEYAVTSIEVRPIGKKFRRTIRRCDNLKYLRLKWQQLTFEDTMHQLGGRYTPLILKPFEYRELYGHYWNPIGKYERIKDKPEWRDSLFQLKNSMMSQKIQYRINFADGKKKTKVIKTESRII